MATKEQLERALRNAHAAGDTITAQRFADELRKMNGPTLSEKAATEFEELPMWQKPIKAVDDLLRVGSDALTFGGTDHLRVLFGTQPDIETARQETQKADVRSGVAGDVAEIGAALPGMMLLPNMTVPARAGPILAPVANTALAALEGAGYGGLSALGHGESVPGGQAQGAIFGVLGNTIAKTLGKGMDYFTNRGVAKQAVDPFDLRLEKDRAYHAMEDENVHYKPSYVDDLVTRLDKDVKDAWPGVNEGAIGAHKRAKKNLRSGGQGFRRSRSMAQIDKERQNIARDAAGSPDQRDRPFGYDMKKSIDDWMDEAQAPNVTSRTGNADEALDMLHKGRELNTRVERLDMLDERLGKARRQAQRNLYSSEDSTIKQNVGSILDDPKKRAQFTEDQLAQMEIVNSGTSGSNFLRQLGRMAPGGGMSWPAATAGGGIGFALGGPIGGSIGATAPGALGVLAKGLSARSTRKEAERLSAMISSGKDLRKKKTMTPKQEKELARFLTVFGITSAED